MHLLLVALIAIPAVAAPARSVTQAMQAAAAAADTSGHADGPCDQMRPSPGSQQPCDCCASRTCDISACLGTGCLPGLPQLIASVPNVTAAQAWRQPPVPTGAIETPFRPPIV
ncbi:hypothetical protein QLQ15_09390 [Lysobacter sp. LF1]|uniref:CopL family metal-binding regulatory protein n=1 Tax=Lysobacter stagni TaxID=3045172 RepID=A0ABT6XG46_9GAMM|nr:hypothetical protein [Lysobacter sp. LF1]MDI9239122.1 hypothetical protein [Lysobacter sp. LF1]